MTKVTVQSRVTVGLKSRACKATTFQQTYLPLHLGKSRDLQALVHRKVE